MDQNLDRGLWATWYDLPDTGRDEYLDWLHGTHLPAMLDRPGYLWAGHYDVIGSARDNDLFAPSDAADENLGKGKDYLLLFGAESPQVFCNPNPRQLEEEYSDEDREMLGQRVETRSCIFVDEERVDGPEIARHVPNAAPGPAIQMGTLNMQSIEDEFELGAWYAQDRLPAMSVMPGCISTRKMVSIAGWAKHSVLYEFTSHEERVAQFTGHERSASGAESWSTRVINRTIHAPGSPSIANRIWPEVFQ